MMRLPRGMVRGSFCIYAARASLVKLTTCVISCIYTQWLASLSVW